MDTELVKLLTACVSLITAIISLILLFKNKKNDDKANHVNLVKNNSGTVNQNGNSYNYTDNRKYVRQTQIVNNTTSGKNTMSGDIGFLVIVFLAWFPFSNVLENNLWVLKLTMVLVQLLVTFCIYKNVQICLPSKTPFTNIIFLISPLLLLLISEIPSFVGFSTINFDGVVLGSYLEKMYHTGSLLLTYVSFIIMLLSHMCSLISPKISNQTLKRFFEGIGRLWGVSLFFQSLSLFLFIIPNLLRL